MINNRFNECERLALDISIVYFLATRNPYETPLRFPILYYLLPTVLFCLINNKGTILYTFV